MSHVSDTQPAGFSGHIRFAFHRECVMCKIVIILLQCVSLRFVFFGLGLQIDCVSEHNIDRPSFLFLVYRTLLFVVKMLCSHPHEFLGDLTQTLSQVSMQSGAKKLDDMRCGSNVSQWLEINSGSIDILYAGLAGWSIARGQYDNWFVLEGTLWCNLLLYVLGFHW